MDCNICFSISFFPRNKQTNKQKDVFTSFKYKNKYIDSDFNMFYISKLAHMLI